MNRALYVVAHRDSLADGTVTVSVRNAPGDPDPVYCDFTFKEWCIMTAHNGVVVMSAHWVKGTRPGTWGRPPSLWQRFYDWAFT